MQFPKRAKKYHYDHAKWRTQMEILDLAYPHVTRWGTAIDGGAYAGLWSIALLEKFHNVVAFEPVEENAACVRENVPAATLVQMALSDVCGVEPYGLKGAGFAHLGHAELVHGEVQCTTIDSREYMQLGLIKLDVEGHEAHALRGAANTLEQHNPVIVVEMKFNPEKVARTLRDYGYEMVGSTKIDQVWVRA